MDALHRLAACCAVLLPLACGGDAPHPSDLAPLVQVSAPSALASGCSGAAARGETLYRDSAVEPAVAVDPADADHLVGVWQQDRWSSAGASGIVAGVSFDGGRTWARAAAPFTRCTGGGVANGGDFERASDPWVALGADGTAWQSALAFDRHGPGGQAILVSRSVDRGLGWSDAVAVARDTGADVALDKESITVDPLDPRRVYVVWDRLTGLTNADPTQGTGPTWLARTTDGGATWEPARPIHDPGQDAQTVGNLIVVLPDGTLLDLLTILTHASQPAPDPAAAVLRSLDHGTTWSAPVMISAMHPAGTVDAKSNRGVRSGTDLATIAVDQRSGAVHVAWQEGSFSGGVRDGIALATSADGGLSWSPPRQVNGAPGFAAFTPALAVAPSGRLGLTYYDLRRDDPADRGHFLATAWLATSTDGGATFAEVPLGPAFDLDLAPLSDGLFLGDYQALAAAGDRFLPFFARSDEGGPPAAVFAWPFDAAAR